MRIGEVAAYTRRFFQLLVAMELGSVVPGNGLEWQTALSDQSQHDPVDGSDCPMRQFLDQTEPGAAINQSQKAVALSRGTHDGVAFPVAGFLAAFNNVRSAIDHRLALQAAPLFRPERALPPTLAALPEVAEQASTSALVLADVAVDGHVTDARIWVVGQVVGDLFRTPLLILQKIFDAVVDLGRVVLYPSRAAASTIGVFLGLAGHVQRTRSVVVDGGVAPDLPADGAGAALHRLGNAAERPSFPLEYGQGVSFRLGELVVHGGFSLGGVTLPSLPARLSILGRRGCCTYFVNLRGLTIP